MAGLKKSGITIDKDALFAAIEDQMAGTPSKMTPEQVQAVMTAVTEKMQATAAKQAEATAAAGKQWLEANKSKEGVQTTASGLQYSVKKEGTGAAIAKGDLVSVEYEGRLTNGEVFDSNKGGKDFDVPVVDNTVIKGWIEGLQLMKQGGEYTLYIPADLAYGNASPSPKIPAGSVLVFDIKVNAVRKGEGTKMPNWKNSKRLRRKPKQPLPLLQAHPLQNKSAKQSAGCFRAVCIFCLRHPQGIVCSHHFSFRLR